MFNDINMHDKKKGHELYLIIFENSERNLEILERVVQSNDIKTTGVTRDNLPRSPPHVLFLFLVSAL